MQRKRQGPPTVADVLAEVARRAGSEPLLAARAEAAVRAALGPMLAPRLRSVMRPGRTWTVGIEGVGEAAAVARLVPELLALLRGSLRSDAPDSLVVTPAAHRPGLRSTRGAAPTASETPAAVGPLTQQALAGVGDAALRARLERFAQRSVARGTPAPAGLVREADPR